MWVRAAARSKAGVCSCEMLIPWSNQLPWTTTLASGIERLGAGGATGFERSASWGLSRSGEFWCLAKNRPPRLTSPEEDAWYFERIWAPIGTGEGAETSWSLRFENPGVLLHFKRQRDRHRCYRRLRRKRVIPQGAWQGSVHSAGSGVALGEGMVRNGKTPGPET